MENIRRKLAAAILSLALVLSMMPAAGLTAWADEGDNAVSSEEAAGEEAGKSEGTQLQTELGSEEKDAEKGGKGLELKLKAEGDEEGSPEEGEGDQGDEDASVSFGDEAFDLGVLTAGYTSAQAAELRTDIVIRNTGSTAVKVSPENLEYYSSNFTFKRSTDGPKEIAQGETAVLGTVEPKAGLSAGFYRTEVEYEDGDLTCSNWVYLTVLHEGISMDVYDEYGASADEFDLGSYIAGSDQEVSEEFWVKNSGTVPFRPRFRSTNDLFRASANEEGVVKSDEYVKCTITVDPQKIKTLEAGTYTGVITVTAAGTRGSALVEKAVPVSLKVTEKPVWRTAETSDIHEAGKAMGSIRLYIDNTDAYGYYSDEYLKADLVEGEDSFYLDDEGEVWKDYAKLFAKDDLGEGIHTAKIRLLYDATGHHDWENAEDLGTMTYTLEVVSAGSFSLELANKVEYEEDIPVIDLGVLPAGYTERQAKAKETVLRFKNSGTKDLEVSGNGFDSFFDKNGETFVWNEDTAAATLKPGDEYSEIRIRPQTGNRAGFYYDYFTFADDNGRCYEEFFVSYLVANKGQSVRLVESGGFFDDDKDIDKNGVIFDPSYAGADAKRDSKIIYIYNTGKDPIMLNLSRTNSCNGIYSFESLGSEAVKVEPGMAEALWIDLDPESISGKAGIYKGSFTLRIADEKNRNAHYKTVPVSYTITDKSYHVSLDLQGRGVYDVKKAEEDFPEGTTYKEAIKKLNSTITGDTRWPVDDKYTVVGFTKKKDSELNNWDELIAAQEETAESKVIDGNTSLYVNWAEQISVADVEAAIPHCGTPAGTAVDARVDKDAPYKLTSASWKDMDDEDVLEGDNTYPLEVKLAADFGYAFGSDSSIRINGVYASKTSPSNSVISSSAKLNVRIRHKWDRGRITRPATIYRCGEKTYTCTVCGKTKTEKISVAEAVQDVTGKIGEKIAEWLRKISGGINPYVPYDPYDPDEPDDPDPQEDPDTPDELSIALSDTDFVYNGKRQVPEITKVMAGDIEFEAGEYEVVYPKKSVDAGDYKVTVKVKAGGLRISGAAGYSIAKAANPVSVSGGSATVKYKKLKKRAQTVGASSVMSVSNAKGSVTYELVSVSKAKYRKYFSVDGSSGNVNLRKKLRKGTYTVTVLVTAAGDKNHNAASRYVSFRIRVK